MYSSKILLEPADLDVFSDAVLCENVGWGKALSHNAHLVWFLTEKYARPADLGCARGHKLRMCLGDVMRSTSVWKQALVDDCSRLVENRTAKLTATAAC